MAVSNRVLAALMFFFLCLPASAETLSPALQFKVKKISANIAKSRASLAANGPIIAADALKSRQFRQRVESYAASLEKMPQVDDPVLDSAKLELSELQNEFEATMSNNASGKTATSQQVQAPASSSSAELVSGQRVRVKKLAVDIENVRNSVVVTGPSELQRGDVISGFNKRLQQFADALERYVPYKDDPDVKEAAQKYQALVATLTTENQRAQSQLAQLGNVQSRIAGIDQKLRANPRPEVLYPNFDEAVARAWIAELSNSKKTAVAASEEIKEIAAIAYLPENRGTPEQGAAYDSKDLQRLFRNAQNTISQVDETVKKTQKTLKERFDFQNEVELKAFREMDPQNKHQQANLYLSEGAEAEVLSQIDRQMALAHSVAAYQRAFGREPTENTHTRIGEIKGLREQYLKDRQKLLGDSRLPAAVSDDANRMAIAKKILAHADYGFGEHGPIVLTTADIVSREKEVSRDTIKDVDVSLSGTITLSGTRETWQYQWEEFKFASPLKSDDGSWHIWWITAKKYSSGWEKTPIGVWLSGSSVQGSLILPENF